METINFSWKPITEIPTEHYENNDASIYICEESDNMIDVILEMVCWLKKEEYI